MTWGADIMESWASSTFPILSSQDDGLGEGDDADSFGDLRPAAWVPGVVPVELLVARSAEAAVVVARIAAYRDGFELTVNSYLRRSVKRRRRVRIHHPMWHDMAEPGDPSPEELLRFGLAWPDGRQATNLDDYGRNWPDATEVAHGLESQGGGGSDHQYHQEYWAWPVPAPGALTFVVEWPAFGIAETTATIDGNELVDAASQSRPIWPEDADRASHISRGAMVRAANERRDAGGGFTER